MRMADIKVGEDYAIRWGSGTPMRATVTYVGKDRRYVVTDGRAGAMWTTGPRVFFTPVERRGGSGGRTELDTSAAMVLYPWAHQQAILDAEATAEQMHAARLHTVEAAVMEASGRADADVRWDYLHHSGRYSTRNVLVNIEVLAAALGVDLPPEPDQ